MRSIDVIIRATAVVVLCGGAASAMAQTSTTPGPDETAAAAYCASTGGVVQGRQATFGTNNPRRDWLMLAGKERFCQYTASDGSTINLSLLTLNSTEPTLAALAYYALVPWNGQGNGNPASFYCSQLGGAEIGATEGAGGAWVSKGGADETLETCVFPDNSTIDSWGLLYHSVGTIRGVDLATVLRYPNPYGTSGKKTR